MTFNVGDYVVLTGAGWGVSDFPEEGTVVRLSGERDGIPTFTDEGKYDYLHVWDDTGWFGGVLLSDVLKPGVRVEYRIPSRANEFAWGTYEGSCNLGDEDCPWVEVDGRNRDSRFFRRVDLDSVPKPDEALVQVASGGTGTIASGPLMGTPVVQREDGKWEPLNGVSDFTFEFEIPKTKGWNEWEKLFFPDPEPTTDAISPDHYQFGEAQVIDITRHLPFPEGNVVKYVSRAGRKGDRLEDLLKARKYLDWAIENAEESGDGLD